MVSSFYTAGKRHDVKWPKQGYVNVLCPFIPENGIVEWTGDRHVGPKYWRQVMENEL